MPIQYRRVEPADVPKCVELVATDPVISRRYGNAIADLGSAMLRLVRSPYAALFLFEEVNGADAKVWGLATAVFVNDAFVREVKTPPFFWIGPELARRIIGPNSPVLSDAQLRAANSTGGVNIMVLQGSIRPMGPQWSETYYSGVTAFFENYRGYRVKEIVGSQAESSQFLLSMFQGGVMFLDPAEGCWVEPPASCLDRIVAEPHVVGLSRDLAARRPGSWFGSIFDYRPPEFGLSRSQQRLLLSAFGAATDDKLAETLGITCSAVKKAWLAIYDRVDARLPGLLRDSDKAEDSDVHRGKEKKRRLLSYLRQHPEELRPFSRAVLSRSRSR